MTHTDNDSEVRVETLKNEISGLKDNIHELRKILLNVDMAEAKQTDSDELEKVDRLLDETQ